MKATDFIVTEDGKAQQIKVFEYPRLEETARPATALAQRPDAPAAQSATAPGISPPRSSGGTTPPTASASFRKR
jgi:hypothetical protein